MSETNPMEKDVDFINSTGNGVRFKEDGSSPQILESNQEVGRLVDTRDLPYSGSYQPNITDKFSGATGITSLTPLNFRYFVVGEVLNVEGSFEIAGSDNLHSIYIDIPIDKDFSTSDELSGSSVGVFECTGLIEARTTPGVNSALITLRKNNTNDTVVAVNFSYSLNTTE